MNEIQRKLLLLVVVAMALGAVLMQVNSTFGAGDAKQAKMPAMGEKVIEVSRGYTQEAIDCVECHAKKTPGIVENWRDGRMAHASISCYDCHVVKESSPMKSQCSGLKGSKIFISPMVSSDTCSRCHPVEVEQFLESGHAMLSGEPVIEEEPYLKLMYHFEGAGFLGVEKGTGMNRASRASGCQMCHGTQVELGPDNKPINETWPSGVGARYPDGTVGNCTVCHTRHKFDISEARKPDACASCHLGPDHPDIEIYENSKHGQMYAAHGEEWNWSAAPDTWEPGDYKTPTCAVCHMSGIGELETTHNVNERLKWNMWAKRSEIRSGERGDGEKGEKLMAKVCANCHGESHYNSQRDTIDNSIALYNLYYDGATKMLNDLKEKGLLKDDPWSDPMQELHYFLWHHSGRRARQGAAMNGPDYAHWHGFFQMFQVYKDMQALYDYRIENNQIEELSPVMSTAPD